MNQKKNSPSILKPENLQIKLFIASFRFQTTEKETGTFSVTIEAKSLFSAEKKIRKHLLSLVGTISYFKSGSQIFLLEIIEIKSVANPVMFNLTKKNPQNNAVFFAPLPANEQNATLSHSLAPADIELFLEF